MARPSILIVTRNYPPLTGGMERLMQHSVETLATRFEVTLIGPTGCSAFAPQTVKTIECSPAPFSFLTAAIWRGWRAARKTSFDLVLGGSGLVAPVTLILAGIARARSALFVHGLDLVVDNIVYQKVFVPFIRRHDRIIANSQNTRRIAIDKGCRSGRLVVVNPGSTMLPQSVLNDRDRIRSELGLAGKKVVLFVGRMVRRKGLAEFLEKAWPGVRAERPDTLLLVAGDSPDDALRQDPEGAKRLIAATEPYGDATVRFLGAVEDDVLWNCYAAADVLIFPLIRVQGDVEGFGMVAIEAAASGTPTVAFPVGGIVDAVADGISGRLVTEGDYEEFANAVISICNGAPPSRSDCRGHAKRFDWQVHGENLLQAVDFAAESTLEQQ